jgi:hypothetical protein
VICRKCLDIYGGRRGHPVREAWIDHLQRAVVGEPEPAIVSPGGTGEWRQRPLRSIGGIPGSDLESCRRIAPPLEQFRRFDPNQATLHVEPQISAGIENAGEELPAR